jgi:diguanylate cyclase (GGDEF)-like protein
LLDEDGIGRGTTVVDDKTDNLWTLADGDPAEALAPIRRLVMTAFVVALIAGLLLISSTLHVMWTTDELSMGQERSRAAAIADILADMPETHAREQVLALGRAAGLQDLTLASAASAVDGEQSTPLLGGPLGGSFLTWTADRPGLELFRKFAPMRVPLMLVMICGVLACLVVMQRRVRKIETQRILAQRRALRDHLTDLPNRLALEGEFARLASQQQHFSVLALDLDRFKPVNDLFGHHAGDQALIEVAERLVAQLRPGEFLARVGGDEFVMIVERGQTREALTRLARDCIASVSMPLRSVGGNVSVGISLGIVADGLNHPASALLKQADRALYEAKRLAGGAFCFATTGPARPERAVVTEPMPLAASG